MEFILSFISCTIIILVLSYMAPYFKLIDYPNERKLHSGNVPLIGGIAIFLNIFLYIKYIDLDFHLLSIFYSSCIILILGALDDAIELGVILRLISQLIAILLVLGTGISIIDLGDYAIFNNINLGIFGILLTVVSVLGLTNAINFIDGIDGLCASTVLIALLSLIFYSLFLGTYFNFGLVYMLICSIIIFLVFNINFINKFKIFLGDSGSMLLGFLLSWILIYYTVPEHRAIHPVLTIWCVALPVFDILGVIFRRAVNKLNPFKPDRRHLHHILLDLNVSTSKVYYYLVIMSITLSLIGGLTFYFLGSLMTLLCFIICFITYTYIVLFLSKKINLQKS